MSIWDALTGRKSSSQTPTSTAPAAPSAPTTPTTTFTPTPFDPTSAQGVEAFLGSSSFADPSQLHPLAGLNKDTLDYLSLEDSALSDLPGSQSALPSRGFTDDLCYGTGTTYLAGLALGGAWGLQEGLRKSAGEPPKLRLNSVLNSVTRRGPFMGNSAGVVAVCYNCINSYIGYMRGKNDAANTIVAGALSGMLFKSTRGLRPMLISGGIVASVAGAWAVGFILVITSHITLANSRPYRSSEGQSSMRPRTTMLSTQPSKQIPQSSSDLLRICFGSAMVLHLNMICEPIWHHIQSLIYRVQHSLTKLFCVYVPLGMDVYEARTKGVTRRGMHSAGYLSSHGICIIAAYGHRAPRLSALPCVGSSITQTAGLPGFIVVFLCKGSLILFQTTNILHKCLLVQLLEL